MIQSNHAHINHKGGNILKNQNEIYTIGDIAEICNIPVKTLRYYDEIDLLTPSKRNTDTNYRYYSKEQMLTLFIIKKLKSFGFSLEDIKKIVYSSDVNTINKYLSKKSEEINQKIDSLQDLSEDLSATLDRLEKGASILNCFSGDLASLEDPTDIIIEEIPRFNCVFTRKTETNYDNASVSIARWFEVTELVKKHNLRSIGVIQSTYHNNTLDQFLKRDCDLEVCIPVYEALDTSFFKISGGYRAVTTMHKGSHSTIINTHIRAIKWINQHKLSISGPVTEEYVISPVDVINEEEYLTKIIIPIE